VRRNRFQGVEVFVIQQRDGTLAHIPCWMMREDAERFALRSQPRIPLDTLRDLRIEIDAILDLLLSNAKTGEASNEAGTARTAAGPIRKQRTSDQATFRFKSLVEMVQALLIEISVTSKVEEAGDDEDHA
jgi:hypothetical protein